METKLPIALGAGALSLSILEGIYFWNAINALKKDVSDLAGAMQSLIKKMEENKKQYDANAMQIQGGFTRTFGDLKEVNKKIARTQKNIEYIATATAEHETSIRAIAKHNSLDLKTSKSEPREDDAASKLKRIAGGGNKQRKREEDDDDVANDTNL